MKPSRYFALGFVLLIGTTAAAALMRRPSFNAPRVAGRFADAPRRDSLTLVGAIDADVLTRGPVIALADDGVRVFVLQERAWFRVGPGGTHGPFGFGPRSGPAEIRSATDIAVSDSLVYVLDRSMSAVRTYNKKGTWVKDLRVGMTGTALTMEKIAADTHGGLLVSALARRSDGVSERVFLYAQPNGPFITVGRVPSSVFYPVIPVAPLDGRHLYALSTEHYELLDLKQSSVRRRNGAPRFPLPPDAYRNAVSYSRMISNRSGRRVEPPRYLPMLTVAAQASDSTLAVAVVVAEDSVVIERIDRNARPVSLLTAARLPLPVGLSAKSGVAVREVAQQTHVIRYHFE